MTCLDESMRIGGEFEFSVNCLGDRTSGLIGPSAPYVIWTDTGRSALYTIARAIRASSDNGEAWIPAYCCKSVSEAFRQAGFRINYYPAGDLIDCASESPQPSVGDVLLVVHYFGHRNDHMLEAFNRYRAAGVVLIEDFVQAGLNSSMGLTADFGVTSYRKLLPVPDGAMIMSLEPINLEAIGMELAVPDEAFISGKLLGKVLRAQGAAATDFLSLLEDAEATLIRPIIPRKLSYISQWILTRLDIQGIAKSRRDNWLQLQGLLTQLIDAGHLRQLMPDLEEDEVPLGFPIIVARGLRNQLKQYLTKKKIYCPVHWELDFLPTSDIFAREKEIAASTLTLPIDQRMTHKHVEYMVESIKEFFREVK